MNETVALFKLLSEPNRLAMFVMLMEDDYCVCDIEAFLNMKQANVSKHLMRFRALNLLSTRKEYQWIHYTLSDDARKKHRDLCNYVKTTPLYQSLHSRLQTFEKNSCKPKEITL